MKRNKKMVLLSHCLLNVNAKVDGLADISAGSTRLVLDLLEEGYGIIQLPCVEQLCFGISRWGQVKEQLDFPFYRRQCRNLLQPVLNQVQDFMHNGYEISAVIGIDGSPTCGVDSTCRGSWGGEIGDEYRLPEKIATLHSSNEPGVMMEVLGEMLQECGLNIRFMAVEEENTAQGVSKIMDKLKLE